MKKSSNKRSGFTLIEIVMGLAILIIGVYAGMQAISLFSSGIQETKNFSSKSKSISVLLANIRSNIQLYQKVYLSQLTLSASGKSLADTELSSDRLAYAWNGSGLAPIGSLSAQELAQYKGRLGFVILPMDLIPGAYLVTVRVVDDVVRPNLYKDYRFIAGDK